MSVTARPRATRAATTRLVGAPLALSVVGAARGVTRTVDSLAPPTTPPTAPPGRPAGTIAVPAEADVPGTVGRVRTAVTGTGGTVVTVVDHAADAAAAGVSIPPSTEVIGAGLGATPVPGRPR
jgi:hypothetical protein